jgi:hypothetical protein
MPTDLPPVLEPRLTEATVYVPSHLLGAAGELVPGEGGPAYVTAAYYVPMTLAPLTPAQEAEVGATLERARAHVDARLRERFAGGGVGVGLPVVAARGAPR